jgi:hypothetical protein
VVFALADPGSAEAPAGGREKEVALPWQQGALHPGSAAGVQVAVPLLRGLTGDPERRPDPRPRLAPFQGVAHGLHGQVLELLAGIAQQRPDGVEVPVDAGVVEGVEGTGIRALPAAALPLRHAFMISCRTLLTEYALSVLWPRSDLSTDAGRGPRPLGVAVWPLAEVLALPAADSRDVLTRLPWHSGLVLVADVLEGKRRWPTYAALLEDVQAHGIREPLRYSAGTHQLYDGHTRAAVAQALGLEVVPVLTTERPVYG